VDEEDGGRTLDCIGGAGGGLCRRSFMASTAEEAEEAEPAALL